MKSRAFGQTPRAVARAHRLCGEVTGHTQTTKFREATATCLPLFPHNSPKAAVEPRVQVAKYARGFAAAKIAKPAAQIAVQLACHLFQSNPASPPSQLTNPVFEALNCLRGNATLWSPVIRKTVPEKLPIPETYDRPPEVSLTASRAQPPDLRSVSLMDKDFAVNCQLVRHSRLISDFCSSAHAFDPRFFQTTPHDTALALR